MPVGTILPYVGSLADIPSDWHLCDGTDGTPNLLDNRFLEGDATPGIFKEPGLPNITGFYCPDPFNGSAAKTKEVHGAFTTDPIGIGGLYAADVRNIFYEKSGVFFDASLSNPIYGASNTVQPKSYTVYFIIKIK